MQSAAVASTVLLGDPIAVITLASSAIKVLSEVLKYRDKPENEPTQIDPRNVPPELFDKIQLLLRSEKPSTPSIVELSRQAVREAPDKGLGQTKVPEPEVVALALAVDSDSVFRDARKRTGLVFQLNLGFAIVLGIILLAGIAGSMYSALVLQKAAWATVFGGVNAFRETVFQAAANPHNLSFANPIKSKQCHFESRLTRSCTA